MFLWTLSNTYVVHVRGLFNAHRHWLSKDGTGFESAYGSLVSVHSKLIVTNAWTNQLIEQMIDSRTLALFLDPWRNSKIQSPFQEEGSGNNDRLHSLRGGKGVHKKNTPGTPPGQEGATRIKKNFRNYPPLKDTMESCTTCSYNVATSLFLMMVGKKRCLSRENVFLSPPPPLSQMKVKLELSKGFFLSFTHLWFWWHRRNGVYSRFWKEIPPISCNSNIDSFF